MSKCDWVVTMARNSGGEDWKKGAGSKRMRWWSRRVGEERREEGEQSRLQDHMAAPGLQSPCRLTHPMLRLSCVCCARAHPQARVCLRTLRWFPNKASRLTGHIASNEKSGRKNDGGRKGRKDLATNGTRRRRPRLKHLASETAATQQL